VSIDSRPSAELVARIAAAMSLTAMSIDAMLPAMGTMASELGASGPNDRQLVLTAFFGGLTLGQLVQGPLSDAIGRRRAMAWGFAVMAIGTLACLFAPTFGLLLAGRVIAGIGAAAARIVSLAIVRDLVRGPAMAKVMSFVTSVFILVPIVAPSVGQGVLILGSWRLVFVVLVLMIAGCAAWFALRQEETLPPEKRRPLSARPLAAAFLEALRHRQTLGFTLAAGLVFGALIAYLATAQQIFGELYGLGSRFPLFFAALASSIGVSSLVNARLVHRFGMFRLSRAAMIVSVILSASFLVVALSMHGVPPLWAFMAYMLVVFFCNGLLFGNFNALAMEPMGHIAGSAASVIGSLTSLVSLAVGTPIGRAYDATVVPLVGGLFALTLAGLVVAQWARPRLPTNDAGSVAVE